MMTSSCCFSSVLSVSSHIIEFSLLDFKTNFKQIIQTMSVIVQSAGSALLASGGLGEEYTQLLAVMGQLISRQFLPRMIYIELEGI